MTDMKKIFSVIVLALVALTASAYHLTVGAPEHGTLTFKVNDATVTTANKVWSSERKGKLQASTLSRMLSARMPNTTT